ncbi:beta-ketoacyl synthase [Nostoc linckia z18]|uniref:Beta-ketoacyl synthase n=2 Tax=Nostoc linckia TaxID=92942 RepID=A0A9Q6ELW5_NOSLI|nr:type I polyketide synthase [Nostoc linckia]PHK38406.1 beta-ketoacyl synthase [Nostoc linckia z15]PHK46878.1 beta-ketoacyl synthase [Nostoc linckia z16]PHJ61312.1 beta-ketoacyl synthase [Nostoc linckia z1]PHJ68076.1 beta-ketoacyl synthase [Nostoc linckia z3]PHJ74403.1 beta-ketoacyl synthase [Nostoc linckia z2]
MAASRIEAVLAQLQEEVSNCEQAVLKLIEEKKTMVENSPLNSKISTQRQQVDIAIIGMASIFPQSQNLQEYWEKIIHKVDCITDVPASRWNIEEYYDPNPRASDKTYCKRGGFIPDVNFNPMEFGLPPNILEVTDISQLLGLIVAKAAMEDAGYGESRQFDRQATGVILGVALGRQLGVPLTARMQYPVWEKALKSSGLSDEDTQKIIEKIKSAYVQWEENAFPGMLANVVAGRIANRLDFGGTNCVVDAACASSLGALKMAISELVEHRADMMLTGGVDTDNSILAYMCFSKTPAVSPGQNVKPFDAESDGMMLGEGVGMLVLKRLADAERDGDRIYAVIKGIGTSSDGRYKSIYAPRTEGQVRALRRAYQDAGFSPASVGLIEAHGTGTMAGDPAEFNSIKEVFGENNPKKQYIALGTVKSQIGHTKAAAGAASLIKTALALHHKVLPPTINVSKPHPKLDIDNSPFYLNTETRPWITSDDQPRRAGVSSFGFGGTNYHVILEEYKTQQNRPYRLHKPAQSVLLFASTPEELLSRCQAIKDQLQSDTKEQHYAQLIAASQSLEIPLTNARLGFVADSLTQASNLLQTSIELLKNKLQVESWEHPQGIYYRKTGIVTAGKVVALFSGQGSQYLEMGRELTINFPSLAETYTQIDGLLSADNLQPVSEVVFPPPVFDLDRKTAQMKLLQQTEYAQPAIGAFSAGLYKILQQAGFKPDFVAGHSFGELTALWAAGVLSGEDYFFLVKARGQAMATPTDPQFDAGAMLAVKGDVNQVAELIQSFPEISIANLNSQNQMVLAGKKAEIANVEQALKTQGFSTVLLPVSAAFHTSLVAYAQQPFAKAIEKVTFNEPQIPVYTNVTGKRYPNEAQVIQKVLKEHLKSQVLFKEEIENIYAEGGYCFVEFGPRSVLTNLVKDILGHRPHLAVALNPSHLKDSDRSLKEAVVQLRVAGLPLQNLDPHQLEQKIPEVSSNKLLNIRLNSTNYVSEKTKQSFEKAMQNGHQVKFTTNGNTPHSPTSPPTTEKLTANHQSPVTNGNNHNSVTYNPPRPTEKVTVNNGVKSLQNGQSEKLDFKSLQTSAELPLNYLTAIDNLEYTLIEFNRHQHDILQIHEQSLKHQTEYTKTFFQLMEQQHELWRNTKFNDSPITTQQQIVSSSERSIMRFHDHQGESLRIHEEYLNYQQEYTHNLFQLLQQHYQLPSSSNTIPQSLIPPVNYQDSPTVPLSKEDDLILNDAPVVLPSNGFASKSEPILTNGNGTNHQTIAVLDIAPSIDNQTAPAIFDITQPKENLTPTAPVVIDQDTLSQTLLNVVSDKTGYPTEMLELTMDIEADLGIDSIKRVEILGALLELYPDLPKPNPEEIGQLRTLAQIAEYMAKIASEISAGLTSVIEADGGTRGHGDVGTRGNGDVETRGNGDVETRGHGDVETRGHGDAGTRGYEEVSSIDSVDPELTQNFLNVVSDKTGYPTTMLDLSMDMETDLGIDGVKLVEIQGALSELYPNLPKLSVETLAQVSTLGQVLGYIQEGQGGQGGQGSNFSPLSLPMPQSRILRSPVRLKYLPEADVLDFTLADGHIALLTDDGSVTTAKLAEILYKGGWKVVVLSFPQSLIPGQLPLPEGINRVVLADLTEEHLQQQLTAIATNYGQIAAFIHLNPSNHKDSDNHVRYLESEKAILRHVFLIAKYLKEPLNQAATQGRSCFVTVARLDGQFGLGQKTNFGAIGAGLFGLTKTLNQEWESVFCRAIDLSPDLDPQTSTQYILSELQDPNLLVVEVGYGPQGRSTLVQGTGKEFSPMTAVAPLGETPRPHYLPNAQSVFLVSGGAKGITAQCVIELAQRYQCKFILLGRSAAGAEPVWAEGYLSEADLKKRIMEDFIARGDKPTPAMVQKRFNAISSSREIAATLQAIEQAGGEAEYLSVDVTDGLSLAEQVTSVVERFGAITGIIHGAGNLADKRIEKKSLQDFETVYAAKVKGLENLLQCVSPNQLNHLVLFSSVVGFYGNVGQSDYAIANEILNKSAHLFKLNYPHCHVVAINWGPWDSGMVSPELKQAFAERNIETIPIEIGTKMLADELANANQQIVQVLIGSPLVYIPDKLSSELKTFRIHRHLTLAANPFLQDHVIAGYPVLPATCGLLWIANTCEQLYPGYKAFSCTNYKVLKGLIFDENLPTEYTLDLREVAKNGISEIDFDAKIWSKTPEGKIRYHFSSQMKLKREIPDAPIHEFINLSQDNQITATASSLYQNGTTTLFHGATFQGVKSVLNANLDKITIECYLPEPKEQQQGQFPVQTFNPYIADVEIHAFWIWSQHFHQVACLPSEITTFEQFLPVPFDETFYVSCQIKSKTESSLLVDVIAHDAQGKIYTQMLGAKGTILPKQLDEI